MRLTRRKLVVLAAALNAVGDLTGIKFAYGVAKNGKKVGDEVEALRAGLKYSKRFTEYEKKRVELCEKHCRKDEHGRPVMIPSREGPRAPKEFVGVVGDEAFEKEHDKLKEEYQSELDEREELVEKYDDALDEEVEFEFYMIKLSDIPKNITAGQLSGIFDIVEGGEAGKEKAAVAVDEPEELRDGEPKKGA